MVRENIHETRIVVKENPAALAGAAARFFLDVSLLCGSQHRHCSVAVSGGSTPRVMYRLLAKEPLRSRVPWHLIDLFWVDERCVPSDDPASNYGTVKRDMLDHVPLSLQQTHPMPGNIPPDDGRTQYEHELQSYFHLVEDQLPVFDLIFLGVGTDGHTASLFPGHDSLNETKQLVRAVKGGKPDVNRLTMTVPVLNSADRIVFLVSGKEKTHIVEKVFSDNVHDDEMPVRMIKPEQGVLVWLLDRAAASGIPETVLRQIDAD